MGVPLRTADNQWTQFEEFPRFMESVESVRQVDDTHLHWVAEIMLQLDHEPEGLLDTAGERGASCGGGPRATWSASGR